MDNIEKLRDIAEYLGLGNIVSEIEGIDFRSKQENANLILPLVGEFSSGKTTLINALTDSKKLETATMPTTATIYEIHFGCDSCSAKVVTEQGQVQNISDIAELKNDTLADAKVVTVFDTSERVPSTTILVDTPGLSSPDPKHKQTLVNFLPKADGILLVTDINQQVTRSLIDFIETMKLSKRPIYLILTKSDTKSDKDIDAAKKYISENCRISIEQVAVVSATTDSLDEIYALLESIQKDKKDIIKRVDTQRISNIVSLLTKHIEELMSASSSDKELDEAIRRSQYELEKVSRNIDRLVESLSDDIEAQERDTSRHFEDVIFSKLNALVTGKSGNFDAEAVSIINNTATLLMNDYRNCIQTIIREKAAKQRGTDNEISLKSLEDLDFSSYQLSGLSYNIDLNTMGHEYDGWIKTGVLVAGAAGAIVATGGLAAGATTVATADQLIDIADTVTDVGSIISNQKTVNKIEKAVGFATQTMDKYQTINQTSQQMGQQMGQEKGMIDSLVGFFTEKMMSKPQRVRAIRNYLDSSLVPELKSALNNISCQLVKSISNSLHNEAAELIGQKTVSLNQLKEELKTKKELFEQRMEQLRNYKTILLTF